MNNKTKTYFEFILIGTVVFFITKNLTNKYFYNKPIGTTNNITLIKREELKTNNVMNSILIQTIKANNNRLELGKNWRSR